MIHQEGTEKFLEVVGYTGTETTLSLPKQAAGILVKKITSLGNNKVLTQLHIPEGKSRLPFQRKLRKKQLLTIFTKVDKKCVDVYVG